MLELIENRFEKFIDDLAVVVNIDSGSGYVPGLEAVRAFFRERFQKIGWLTTDYSFDDGKVPCLEVSNKPYSNNDSVFDLLFIGHMDTVFAQGTAAARPFSRDKNRAYGPGVCDMKGGLVTMLHLAELMQETGVTEDIAIAMAVNSDEEIGSRGSRAWIESLATKSRCVLVFEPWRATGERVLHRKGGGNFDVICYGKAAHAGAAPQEGANAIIEMAHQIIAVTELASMDRGTSVNVTLINGGTADNVIPDYARACVDVRIADTDESRKIQTRMQALGQNVHTPGIRVEVQGEITRQPMVPSEKTLRLWQQMAAIGEGIGLEMKLTTTGGCSDGNFTAALGIPTIDAMGVRGGCAHSEDEYIDLDSIVPNLHLICEFVKALADGRMA